MGQRQGNREEGREGSAEWEGWRERGRPIVGPVLASSPRVRVRDEVGRWWWGGGRDGNNHHVTLMVSRDTAVARDRDAVHV